MLALDPGSTQLKVEQRGYVEPAWCHRAFNGAVIVDMACAEAARGGAEACHGGSGDPLTPVIANRFTMLETVEAGPATGITASPGLAGG